MGRSLITIRNYRETDAKLLWDIFFHTVRRINIRDYTQEQVEAWASDEFNIAAWKKRMAALTPFIAEIDGVVAGYADLQPDGLIDHFFCHHAYQGQGVGRSLMNHVLAVGQDRGVKRFYSYVSITALPFYEHFGFNVLQEQEIEIRGQKLKNFVMEKYC